MSNTRYVPAYLSEPPIYDELFNKDGVMSDAWRNWFNAVTQATGFAVIHDVIADNGPPTIRREDVALLYAPPLEQSDRDKLQNKRNGTVIYNLTTNAFNFRQGGNWVTFTPVPA